MDLHAEGRALARLARVLAGDEADDLVQDAYVVALERSRGDIADRTNWLRGVLRRLAAASARRSRRRRERELRAARPETLPPSSEPERGSTAELLRRLVDELPEHERIVLQRHFWSQRTTREIAEELDRPHSTVRSQLKRGLDTLRDRLDRRHGGRDAWSAFFLAAFATDRAAPRAAGAAGGVGLATGAAWLARRKIAAGLVLCGGTLLLVGALRLLGEPPSGDQAAIGPGPVAASLPPDGGGPLETAPGGRSQQARSPEGDAPVAPAAASALEPGPPGTSAPARLEVTVRDATGATVEGAEVFVVVRGGGGRARSKGPTDAQGRCAWDVLADEFHGFVHPQSGEFVGVFARKPDRVQSDGHDVVCPLGATTSIEVELGGPAARLTGTVVDPRGAPVAGAHVKIGSLKGLPDPRSRPEHRISEIAVHVFADEHGRFDERCLPAGRTLVSCSAPGFGVVEQWVDVRQQTDDELLLRLVDCARVEGEVLDPDGRPFAGAHVRLWARRAGSRATVSLDDGSFVIPCGDAGPVALTVESPEHPGHGDRIAHLLVPGEGFEWQARLGPVAGGWIRVTDEDGEPLGGLMVTLGSLGLSLPPTTTDEHGLAGVAVLPADAFEAVVFGAASRFPLARASFAERAEPWPVVVPRERLAQGTLTGCIAVAEGLSEGRVRLSSLESDYFEVYPYDLASGCFEAVGLPPGTYAVGIQSTAGGDLVFGTWRVEPDAQLDLGRLSVPPVGRAVIELGAGAAGRAIAYELQNVYPMPFRFVQTVTLAASTAPPREIDLYPGLYSLRISSRETGEEIDTRFFRVASGQSTRVAPLDDASQLVQCFARNVLPDERLSLRIWEGSAAEPAHDVLLEAVTPGVFEFRVELVAGPRRIETRVGTREPIAQPWPEDPVGSLSLVRFNVD